MRKIAGQGRRVEFGFDQVDSFICCLGGRVRQVVGYFGLEFKREVWIRDKDVGVMIIQMVFKGVR